MRPAGPVKMTSGIAIDLQASPPREARLRDFIMPGSAGQFRIILTIGFPAVLCRGAGYKQPQRAASSTGGRAKSKHFAGPSDDRGRFGKRTTLFRLERDCAPAG